MSCPNFPSRPLGGRLVSYHHTKGRWSVEAETCPQTGTFSRPKHSANGFGRQHVPRVDARDDAASACCRREGGPQARPPGFARLVVAGPLSSDRGKPGRNGRCAAIWCLFGALTPNIILPSRRDNPITARGGSKASLTSLGATPGREAHPTPFSFHQSESQRSRP